MEFKQLRYFHQVYKDGSILKASENLIVSQQAVSKLIRNLEEELGTALFVRSSRGVKPTECGNILAKETADILPKLDTAIYKIQCKSKSIKGRVSVGFLLGHLGSEDYLPLSVLKIFQSDYPDIKLEWCNTSPRICEEKVSSGEMDFAFSAFPGDPDQFHCLKLYDFEWCIAMSPDNSLAQRPYIAVEDLANQKIIMPKDETHDYQQLVQALPPDGQPEFILTSDHFYDIIHQMIIANNAMMICATPHVSLLNPSVLKIVPFHTSLLRSQIYLLTKRGATLSSVATLVKDYLLDAWGFSAQ